MLFLINPFIKTFTFQYSYFPKASSILQIVQPNALEACAHRLDHHYEMLLWGVLQAEETVAQVLKLVPMLVPVPAQLAEELPGKSVEASSDHPRA